MLLGGLTVGCGPGAPPVTVAPDPAPPVRTLPAPPPSARMGADLEGALRAAPEQRRFTVLVDLTRQIDYDRLARLVRTSTAPRSERRDTIVGWIERVAREQQATLLPVLETAVQEGRLDYYRPVAIVNRLVVEGRAAGILELAERPEVARVLPEWRSARGGRAIDAGVAAPGLGERFDSWALEALGVEALWQQGLDGRGVVVAAIDTGAFEGHEQLAGRRLPGGRGWFDPVQGTDAPHDNHGHGTSVLSLAVGGNPEGRRVGIAPGASWAVALGNWRNTYSRVRMTLAADWVLRVARPDVLINAWSHDEGHCTTFDLDFINAWRAAGIFVVFPAGNAGPAPATGDTPAQLAGAFPEGGAVFSVAGLAPDGEAFRDSSRGPSRCNSVEFPSLAAPGSELPFAHPPSPATYGLGDGTSLTAGLVGGAAALLLQADPELEPWELERILLETAIDVPPAGRDDATGAGALHLPSALARIRARAAARPSSP